MQLQAGLRDLEDAGVRVYALSYDEADALGDFRDAHGITYTLLSDPDSRVIEAFGILNTLIAEDDHPWYGIPFPGTYVMDGDGTITHKFFDSNLAVRAGPEQLLRAVRGEQLAPEALTHSSPEAVSTHVFLDGETLAVSVQRDLVARIAVPEGRHVYASPAPQGSVALALELDPNSGLVVREPIRPPSEPHRLAGAGESFEVHHGTVELRLPLTVNGGLTSNDGTNEVTISGTLWWQVCDDEVCDIPESERFELTVPVMGPVLPDIRSAPDGTAREPNAARHFQRMRERRET